jgi:retron-type reverse transcriptase
MVRTRFVPKIDDPTADRAVAKDIGSMQEKLEVFKAKYPEVYGIRPATSTNELFTKTRINMDMD